MTEPQDSETPPLPRQRFWALVPRRDLVRAVLLLVVLAAVIGLRHRAGALARTFSAVLLGAPAERAPPRVRLAPAGKAP